MQQDAEAQAVVQLAAVETAQVVAQDGKTTASKTQTDVETATASTVKTAWKNWKNSVAKKTNWKAATGSKDETDWTSDVRQNYEKANALQNYGNRRKNRHLLLA